MLRPGVAPIIRSGPVISSTDNTTLHERIDALIAAVGGDPAPSLSRVEHTLTDGYAYALSLEAERWRLERRIGEAAAELHEGNERLKSEEIATLARRLASAGVELAELRERLSVLRDRAAAVKAA